jgi:hypothetical protein
MDRAHALRCAVDNREKHRLALVQVFASLQVPAPWKPLLQLEAEWLHDQYVDASFDANLPASRFGGVMRSYKQLLTVERAAAVLGDALSKLYREASEQLENYSNESLNTIKAIIANLQESANGASMGVTYLTDRPPSDPREDTCALTTTIRAAESWERLFGARPTVHSRSGAHKGEEQRDGGPFVGFLGQIFRALEIEASAGYLARKVLHQKKGTKVATEK